MFFYQDEFIDRWIDDDVPGPDLTSWLLGIGAQSAEINFRTRAPVVVAGLVLSSVYRAEPADIGVRLAPAT